MVSLLRLVSISRLKQRLYLVYSQCWDWDRDFFLCSLNVETETHFWLVSVSRLPNVKTETKIKDGHTNLIQLENAKKFIEIQMDLTKKVKLINNKQESIWTPVIKMSEVARLRHIRIVETETFWDCEISGLLRLRLFETVKYLDCRDWDWLRLIKSCRDLDFPESLADLWFT